LSFTVAAYSHSGVAGGKRRFARIVNPDDGVVRSTSGFQPLMVPSRVLNRSIAGPDFPSFVITNPEVRFRTMPVGVPVGPDGWLGADGTVMVRGIALPAGP